MCAAEEAAGVEQEHLRSLKKCGRLLEAHAVLEQLRCKENVRGGARPHERSTPGLEVAHCGMRHHVIL